MSRVGAAAFALIGTISSRTIPAIISRKSSRRAVPPENSIRT